MTAHTLICRQPSTGKTEVFTYSPESGTVVSSLRGLMNWAGQARWQLDCRLSGHRSALAYSGPTLAELMIDPPVRISGFLKASTLAWLTKPALWRAL